MAIIGQWRVADYGLKTTAYQLIFGHLDYQPQLVNKTPTLKSTNMRHFNYYILIGTIQIYSEKLEKIFC